MTTPRFSDKELLHRLAEAPEIRDRLESLLLAVADEKGDLRQADAAELRLIDEMRQMGRASLSAWAERQVAREAEAHKSGDTHVFGNKGVSTRPPK